MHFFKLFFYRGQPVTTSLGKWLQLELTIDSALDLSRFRFDVTYRVVRDEEDSNDVGQIFYGDPVPGTICSRNLHSCDQRTCIIQSPNFPGIYPRYCYRMISS